MRTACRRPNNFISLMAILFLSVNGTNAFSATNDCNARVAIEHSERSQESLLWMVTFRVTTDCSSSTGKFQYEYRIVPGPRNATLRTVSSWNAALGKSFIWTDEVPIRPGEKISVERVLSDSIESTRIK